MASRQEMLDKLATISFCAVPKEEDFNTGLHYDYVTNLGCGSGHDNLGEWPLLHLAPVEDKTWASIQEKIRNKTIALDDFAGTSFYELVEEMIRFRLGITSEEMAALLQDLAAFEDCIPEGIYCLCDMGSWDRSAHFYQNRQDMIDAFEKEYCWEVSPWDLMDDYELRGWYDRLDGEFSSFMIRELD